MLYSQGRGKSEREHYPQNEDLKAARIKKFGILRCLEYPTKVVLDVLRFFLHLFWSFDSNQPWKERYRVSGSETEAALSMEKAISSKRLASSKWDMKASSISTSKPLNAFLTFLII